MCSGCGEFGKYRGAQRARKQKKTCGSTVFSTGHPRQYSLAPAMLVCADRTRRGRFIAVWPQMGGKDRDSNSIQQKNQSEQPLCSSPPPSSVPCAISVLVLYAGSILQQGKGRGGQGGFCPTCAHHLPGCCIGVWLLFLSDCKYERTAQVHGLMIQETT